MVWKQVIEVIIFNKAGNNHRKGAISCAGYLWNMVAVCFN
jgi:hypothetical protein